MKKQRLRRRVYSVKGPNHMWHIDGNDKIKRFGLCISGAIDGWSHFLIWLKCDVTNKNPTLIANYYLEAVDKHNTIPVTLRMDLGTENIHIQDIQNVLRNSHPVSVILGSSTHNQRIEKFWNYLRHTYTQEYMDLFEDLVLAGLLDPSKPIQIECLRFCFMTIIREELDGIKEHWNLHLMRRIRGVEGSGGIPEFLYNTPESNGGENCGFPVDMHMLDTLSTLFPDMVNPIGCDLDFAD